MSGSVSPMLRRRRLGRQIRELRVERKLSGTQLARKIGKVNQSRLSKVEIGKARLTEGQLCKVIELLEPPAERAEEWRQRWRDGDQLGWWSEYLDVISEHNEMLAGFEIDAAHVRQYVEAHVPTLVATEDYIRAAVSASQLIRPADTARTVEFRLGRRRRLEDPEFRCMLVIAEGALHRYVGGREVIARQFRHLLDTPWAAIVELLVVPFEADVYGAQGYVVRDHGVRGPGGPRGGVRGVRAGERVPGEAERVALLQQPVQRRGKPGAGRGALA